MNKKLALAVTIGIMAIGGASGAGVYAYNNYAAYELKTDKVTIELGGTLNQDAREYVSSNDKAVAGTVMDFTKVDTLKTGTYEATANYKDNTLSFAVVVEDTTEPEVEVAEEGRFQLTEGGTLSGTDIVSKMDDLSGIKSISFSDAETVDKKEEDMLAAITLTYGKEGEYTNTLTVTDNNGNSCTKEIAVIVKADYGKHVSGFHDWTIEEGADIDFTEGIEKDERIASITPMTETVDIAKTGEYELVYNIAGDDQETVIQKSVKVVVVDAASAQKMANNGEVVYVSGNGTKQKETVSASSTSTAKSSGNSGNGNSSNENSGNQAAPNPESSSGSGSSSSQGSDGSSDEWWGNLTPGTSWDIGEPVDEWKSSDGSTWNIYAPIEVQ